MKNRNKVNSNEVKLVFYFKRQNKRAYFIATIYAESEQYLNMLRNIREAKEIPQICINFHNGKRFFRELIYRILIAFKENIAAIRVEIRYSHFKNFHK